MPNSNPNVGAEVQQSDADEVLTSRPTCCNTIVSGSLQAEAIEFAEWIRTFEPLEKKYGFWVLDRQLSSEKLYYHYLRDRERWRNDR